MRLESKSFVIESITQVFYLIWSFEVLRMARQKGVEVLSEGSK